MDMNEIDNRENLLDACEEITNQVLLSFTDRQKVHVNILRDRNGKYYGSSSHSIKTSIPRQGSPYQASRTCDTPEEALNYVIKGFDDFYNKEDLEDNKWIPQKF